MMLQKKTSCVNRVRDILHPPKLFGCQAITFGKQMEPLAREDFSAVSGKKVIDCGLVVDHKNYFLAASPGAYDQKH